MSKATWTVGGLVLCGGASRRMGRPKEWLPIGRELMLQRVVRQVRAVTDPVVVAARPGQTLPDLPPSVRVVRDAVPLGGPLHGMAAGLAAFPPDDVSAAFITGSDMPFLVPGVVRFLLERLGDRQAAVLGDDAWRPLGAVYRTQVLANVQKLLYSEPHAGPRRLLELVSVAWVNPRDLVAIDPQLLSWQNVNDPNEYELACSWLETTPSLRQAADPG